MQCECHSCTIKRTNEQTNKQKGAQWSAMESNASAIAVQTNKRTNKQKTGEQRSAIECKCECNGSAQECKKHLNNLTKTTQHLLKHSNTLKKQACKNM